MKKRVGMVVLAAVVVLGLLATKALTQGGGNPNDINVVQVQPSAGQVVVGGNYTVASGYTFNAITVEVRPTGGVAGEGGDGAASTDGMGNFTATVSVPGGQYDVQAILTVTDGSGTVHYFFSNTIVGVSVPSP